LGRLKVRHCPKCNHKTIQLIPHLWVRRVEQEDGSYNWERCRDYDWQCLTCGAKFKEVCKDEVVVEENTNK